MRLLLAIPLLLLVSAAPPAPATQKIRGMSVAHAWRGGGGYGSDACTRQFAELKAMGVNYVSLSNFAWMDSINRPGLRFRADRTLGEGDTGKAIDDAHAQDLKVMLKPHTWAREYAQGKWHGDLDMTEREVGGEGDGAGRGEGGGEGGGWDAFFANYTAFLVACAKVAEETRAEMLCLGVEYVRATRPEHTHRWRKLIAEVRKVYSGRLTYSAAFTEWRHIEFWNDLDVISIAAYFPLTDKDLATEEELRRGWQAVYRDLAHLRARWNKPIIFSELGYTPAAKAGREPWSYDIENPDDAYQALLFKVALEEAENSPDLEGLFLWKWFSTEVAPESRLARDPFTIQTKPLTLQALRTAWAPKGP